MTTDSAGKRLYVAGGPTGQAYLYDARTGADLAVLDLTTPGTFVNDVVVTQQAAYFTDSFRPVIYRVPLGPDGLPAGSVETIAVTGDFQFVPGVFNLNGIDATPNGDRLIAVSTALGQLYTINPKTGVATTIDLGGDSVVNGDGILLDGKIVYVVQNQFNQIAVVQLSPDLTSGSVVSQMTDPALRVPTGIDEFGNKLYVVNAHFGTPPTPNTAYEVVQLSKD
jgi:hypothetical protein